MSLINKSADWSPLNYQKTVRLFLKTVKGVFHETWNSRSISRKTYLLFIEVLKIFRAFVRLG